MVYDFVCQGCKEKVTVVHKFSEPHPTHHADCGGELVRFFTPASIIYRVSGFYTTDKVLSEPEME